MPHPYTTTMAGLAATVRQLRSNFPATVTADTLKKWSIASNNEAPIIVVLRFLGLIDDQGKKVAANAKAFVEHDDSAFAKKFESIVKSAYSELFETFGDAAWSLEKNKLIGFFRNADGSSARVGQEQANTFLALAGMAGHGPAPAPAAPAAARKSTPSTRAARKKRPPAPAVPEPKGAVEALSPSVTLRVEINLPVTDDQEVYDSIFKSIRAHLLNG